MIRLFPARTQEDLFQAKVLFVEYASSLDFSLDFQDFEEELAGLPGKYAPPEGVLLLARDEHRVAGCVALRKMAGEVCEMKRLFVRPSFRRKGLGRILASAIIQEAKKIGYTRMCLDTVPSMKDAQILYESLGFEKIPPYCYNPVPGAVFLELNLAR
ncbi:MAG: GNAT family N-acetyltransferase [Syntrophaceae bacterium]|nr:GNAT family N-acetyltransferase [Syntrophaceae bacterium]